MKFKNILAFTLILGSTSVMAVEKPGIGPVLGNYKGDCTLLTADQKLNDLTKLKIERDGAKVKISYISSLQNSTSVSSLMINEEDSETDFVNNTKKTELLAISDAHLRKWTHTVRLSSLNGRGVDSTEKTEMDFLNSSFVKIKIRSTLGGQETLRGSCTLDKMNLRAL
jgi:hypothetical protein